MASAQATQSQNTSAESPGSSAPAEADQWFHSAHFGERNPLVFTVTDKHGHYIKDLNKSGLEILDDKKPPEEILSINSDGSAPAGRPVDRRQRICDQSI